MHSAQFSLQLHTSTAYLLKYFQHTVYDNPWQKLSTIQSYSPKAATATQCNRVMCTFMFSIVSKCTPHRLHLHVLPLLHNANRNSAQICHQLRAVEKVVSQLKALALKIEDSNVIFIRGSSEGPQSIVLKYDIWWNNEHAS